jgi:crossover junction endodeoxyribonuclease RuvC
MLVDHLPPDKIGKKQEYQRSYEIVEYYFDIFVQSHSASKITLLLQKQAKIILGIDPGTVIMGYGLVLCSGSELSMIAMGVLKLSARNDAYERLRLIHKKVKELIGEYHPHDFAIEAPFFGKNVQSMLKLGRAQGVAIATAMNAGLQVTEYSPRKIKQSVTGNGNSGKEQVWKMLQTILHLGEEIKEYDASDALAVAVCHHFQARPASTIHRASPSRPAGGTARKKSGDWGSFIKQNPGKVRSR